MSALAHNHRKDYRYWIKIQTRWSDNDMYGHVNNVQYYSYFDTVINTFLIREAGLKPMESRAIGLCVKSQCDFKASLEFPDVIEAGLNVSKPGRTSLTYEIGIFKENSDELAAHGEFIHVFVDRDSRRPTPVPSEIMDKVKSTLVKL